MRPSFATVIPTLNESRVIGSTVRHIRHMNPAADIVVADGGSADGTVQQARQAGARIVCAPYGRGPQMNAGAELAEGDVLIFLHADTRLPSNAFLLLGSAFVRRDVQVGTFRLGFDQRHWLLAVYTFFSRFDSVLTTFGDQCIVIRRDLFQALGRFPEWPLFEDVALLQAARRQTRVHSFPARVVTSARRFREGGIVCHSLRNAWYVAQYLAGVSPWKLAARYERRGGRKDGV